MPISNYNPETYEEIIKEGLTIVDFYGERCGPCEYLSDVLDELIFELPFLNIIKINTTKEIEIAKRHNIRGVPLIHFYKDGEMVKEHLGSIDLENLKKIVGELIY
ncbi:thioredoxin family protein [Lysinibacillus fusiformis]|uniref:thioredoxin family protein n=1 Tax=Lysinibacillus fusiformis TaxID=28031 RepID=UPI001966CE51|nr:thioredoxin family protein [Lysinibacillus fusiformis]QSB08726.1 thioredoxin family protein [Lysinibacillus fusiformis]